MKETKAAIDRFCKLVIKSLDYYPIFTFNISPFSSNSSAFFQERKYKKKVNLIQPYQPLIFRSWSRK